MAKPTTPAYEAVNAENFKEPRIVVQFEGLPYAFSTDITYEKIKYDDPGLNYDQPGIFYDGLRSIDSSRIKTLIDRANTKMTIGQKLEQWDGRASVETLNLALIDLNGLITKLITPGMLLPDILNNRVTVFFGYKDLAYPADYIRIFQGYVNRYTTMQGKIAFDLTDPTSKKKQTLFNAATQTLNGNINNSQTNITLDTTGSLYQTILDAKGNLDSTVTIGILIDSEIMTYTNSGITSGTQLTVTRGAFGTSADAHSSGATVKAFILFEDNPVNICLKLMLSGWNGPWLSDVELRGIINTDNGGFLPDSVTFAQGVDVIRDYGLVAGDFLILSGFTEPSNNGVFTVGSFANDNRTVVVQESGILVQENPPSNGNLEGKVALRSKYDTYPVAAGLSLTPQDVFVSRHEELRDTFIPFDFTLPEIGFEKDGKQYIENHIMKPIGAYTLTQGSKISMGLTHPPLATDLTRILSPQNITRPGEVQVVRGLNERYFYNDIVFNYGYDAVNDAFLNSLEVIDQPGIDRTGQVSTLSIDCRGFPGNNQSAAILRQRAKRLLLRYRYSAETIALTTFFGVGHLIDAGDIVVLTDSTPSMLKLPNTETGERGIYNRVMEVQERSIDLSTGVCKVNLLSNNGFSVTDRYGVIGPASIVLNGIDSSTLQYKESFGGKFPNQEYLKWVQYQGSKVRVHSPDYSRDGDTVFTLDNSNPFIMHLTPALGFVPQSGDIIEFSNYDESSADAQQQIKAPYVFLSYMGTVDHGTSTTVFVLSTGEGANYIPGNIVMVMSPDGTTRFSPNLKIISVLGDIITVGQIQEGSPTNLGFVPQAGDLMKLGGFRDGGQSYRFV